MQGTIIIGTAWIFITTLSIGIVSRGAIETGIAAEISKDKDEIYGPALYHAHNLESEVAHYPRIVIGDTLCEFIASEVQRSIQDTGDKMRYLTAKSCSNWTCKDIDGVPILDYIGPEAKEVFPDLAGTIDNALKFVEKEWHKFQKEGNSPQGG